MKHTILTLLSGAVLLLGMSSCQEDEFSKGDNTLRLTAKLCPTPYASRGTQLNTTGSNQSLSNYNTIVTAFTATCYEKEKTDTDYKTTSFFDKSSTGAETAETDGNTGWTMGNKYIWKSEASLRCFAYANLPASGASVTQNSNALMTLTYTAVPDSASKQNDILLGFFQGTDKNDGEMPIVFSHPLTAVKFVKGKLKDAAGNTFADSVLTIKSIKMKGVYKSGTTTYTVANGTATSNPYRSFTWTPGSGTKDVAAKGIDIPFILIPQNTVSKPVVVEVEVEFDGAGTMTLVGDIKDQEWLPGVTNVYALDYTFTGSPVKPFLNLNPVTAYINKYTTGINMQFD